MNLFLIFPRLGTILTSFIYLSGLPIFLLNDNQPNSERQQTRPDPMDHIQPTTCLYNDSKCQVIDEETINNLGIKNGKYYFIIHGYMENGQRPWIKALIFELLLYNNDSNVIVVDWSEGARPPYNQAVSNIQGISIHITNIISLIQDHHGLQVSSVHLIGHSLGSHLAGLIGSRMKALKNLTIARITGLDPAQPYFEGYPEDIRLDQTDAEFVDVIHTDAIPLIDGGTSDSSGHADFFPNNGSNQPGCKDNVQQAINYEDGSLLYGLRRFLGCDHMRSYEYFTESINTNCRFLSFSCNSYQDFLSLKCSNETNRMGFHATKPANNNQTYYLITGSTTPFCRDHYKVDIRLEEESTRSDSILNLVLLNHNETVGTIRFQDYELRGTDLDYSYLREGPTVSTTFTNLILRPVMSNPLRWFVNRMGPKTPELTLNSITIYHFEKQVNSRFCPTERPYFSVSDLNPNISLSVC